MVAFLRSSVSAMRQFVVSNTPNLVTKLSGLWQRLPLQRRTKRRWKTMQHQAQNFSWFGGLRQRSCMPTRAMSRARQSRSGPTCAKKHKKQLWLNRDNLDADIAEMTRGSSDKGFLTYLADVQKNLKRISTDNFQKFECVKAAVAVENICRPVLGKDIVRVMDKEQQHDRMLCRKSFQPAQFIK
jgi:hypothetical protein